MLMLLLIKVSINFLPVRLNLFKLIAIFLMEMQSLFLEMGHIPEELGFIAESLTFIKELMLAHYYKM